MGFDEDKQKCVSLLGKTDRSLKGSIDERALPVINIINRLDDYYTTSSCSGRIYLIEKNASEKKNETRWLFVSHELVDSKQVLESVKKLPSGKVWFRQEGPIFHVACRDIMSTERFLKCAHDSGYKRAGAFNLDKRNMVEIIATENIEVPIADQGALLVDAEYIEYLSRLANEKLKKSWKTLSRFEAALQNLK